MSSPRKALESFADAEQNPDLLRLESLLTRFNLFEAVGVVRHELRHSDFLAYLLTPSQHHDLGAVFLKELLQAVLLMTEGDGAVSSSGLDAWDLSQATVQREWHHIDILAVDDVNRLAVIIENKIGTGEHSGQLDRYHDDISRHYPGYKIIALFLTPDGDVPSHQHFHPMSYTLVGEVIEKIVQDNRATLDAEVVMILEHYVQMLRRHIASDSDVAELCRSIYQKHRQALDLIFEYRPDQQMLIREYVKTLISQDLDLISYSYGKNWVNFNLQEWDDSLTARGLSLHTTVFPYLTFQFQTDGLTVGAWISPGEQTKRQRLLRMAETNLLSGVPNKLKGREWSRISSFKLLNSTDYEKSQEEIEVRISEKWADFLRDELPRIVKAVGEEKWLWEAP